MGGWRSVACGGAGVVRPSLPRGRGAAAPASAMVGRAPGPLRVVHLLHRLSVDGGVPVVVRRLAEGLDPGRVELHVVTARPAVAADRLDEVPAKVHPLGHTADSYGPAARTKVALGVARVVRSIRPDVLHLHSGTAWKGFAALAAAPRAGVVLEVHDAPGSGRSSAATERVESVFPRFLGATVACHSRAVSSQVARAWGIASERIVRYPLAVGSRWLEDPPPADERARVRGRHGIAPDDFAVVTLGRLVPSKRLDTLVDALALLGDPGPVVRVVLIGRGPEEEALRERARERGVEDRLKFAGHLDDDEAVALVRACDVLCSTSEYEGFGLSVAEAMAVGLPVVATAAGGVEELVEPDTGILVPIGATAELAAAVARLRDDPGLRSRMGAAGHRVARERFTPAALAEASTDLYVRVAKGRRRVSSGAVSGREDNLWDWRARR